MILHCTQEDFLLANNEVDEEFLRRHQSFL